MTDHPKRIQRFRKRPQPGGDEDQLAVRYVPGEPLTDLLAVARMASLDAEVAELTLPSGLTVLVARWTDIPDDHPAHDQWQIVKPGDYLAYSGEFLYDATDGNWRQWYEPVDD